MFRMDKNLVLMIPLIPLGKNPQALLRNPTMTHLAERKHCIHADYVLIEDIHAHCFHSKSGCVQAFASIGVIQQVECIAYCSIECTVRILPSHGQHGEAPRQAFHRFANLPEHPHTARPVLDVLAQPTQRGKLGFAIRLWASVDLVLVARALQVLIEIRERPIRPIAQKALVRHPIPRELGCIRIRRGPWFVPAQGPSEQSRGVRDVVIRVCADDETVQLFARDTRGAGARL